MRSRDRSTRGSDIAGLTWQRKQACRCRWRSPLSAVS